MDASPTSEKHVNFNSPISPRTKRLRGVNSSPYESSDDCSFTDSIDLENSFDEDLAKSLTFEKRESRLSLDVSEFDQKNNELVQSSMNLDSQIEELNNKLDVMEENFIVSFAKITEKRLITEFKAVNGRNPEPIDRMELLDTIDFSSIPYDEWASSIEKIIRDNIK